MAGSSMIQTQALTKDLTTLRDQFQANQDTEVNLETLRPNTNAFRSSKTCDIITQKDTSRKNGNNRQRKTGKNVQRSATFTKPSTIGRPDKREKEPEQMDIKSGDLSILPPITGNINSLNLILTKGQTSASLQHSVNQSPDSPSFNTITKRPGESPRSPDSKLPKNQNFELIADPQSKLKSKSPSSDINDRAKSRQQQNNYKNIIEQPANPTTGSSPINQSDKAKAKFDKKVQKTAADNNNRHVSPSVNPNKSTSPTGQPVVSSSVQVRDAKAKSRRSSLMSVNKSLDEPFSVRRKIEEFRKWHDEQYTDTRITESKTLQPTFPSTDFVKILEETAEENINNHLRQSPSTHGDRKLIERKASNGKDNVLASNMKNENKHRRPDDRIASVRPKSGATWKTWRDANDSDAYKDVNKYIRDNDLMDEERYRWIQTWITDVHYAMNQMKDSITEGLN